MHTIPTIRKATLDDMSSVLEIYNEVVANSTAIYEEIPRTLEQQQSWFESKTQSKFPVFVCEIDRQVMGFASYGSFRPPYCYRSTIELGIHVSHGARGKGIGSTLMSTLIRDATEREFYSMMAGIDAQNSVSLRLHRKFGFKEVGRIPQVGFKFNRWLDLVFMQLIIGGPPP